MRVASSFSKSSSNNKVCRKKICLVVPSRFTEWRHEILLHFSQWDHVRAPQISVTLRLTIPGILFLTHAFRQPQPHNLTFPLTCCFSNPIIFNPGRLPDQGQDLPLRLLWHLSERRWRDKEIRLWRTKRARLQSENFFMVKTWWTLNNILATNLCKRCGETSSILGRRETARAFICSSSIKTLFAKLLRSQINSLPHQWLVTISVGLLLLSLLVLLCTFVSRSFPGGAMPGRRLRMFDRLRRSFQRNNCLSPGVCDSQVSIIISWRWLQWWWYNINHPADYMMILLQIIYITILLQINHMMISLQIIRNRRERSSGLR